jgi:hypothetical protein
MADQNSRSFAVIGDGGATNPTKHLQNLDAKEREK